MISKREVANVVKTLDTSTSNDFIAYALIEFTDGVSKAAVARALAVSTRTVGRMIERVKASIAGGGRLGIETVGDIKKVHRAMKTAHATEGWIQWSAIIGSIRGEGLSLVWEMTLTTEEESTAVDAEVIHPVEETQADVVSSARYSFVVTSRSIVMSRHPNDGTIPETITILTSDEKFDDVCVVLMGIAKIQQDDIEQGRLAEVFKEHSIAEQLKELTIGKIHVDFNKGKVMVDVGQEKMIPVSGAIVNRILSGDSERFVRFLDLLYDNPSYTSIKGLFDFLEATDIDIDEEGYVIALKVVTVDYLDCHTNTFDNSIGAVVKMDRRLVDDNPKSLCSAGLHACSSSYVSRFRSGSSRLVKVRIHPKDVVSVPEEYTTTDAGGNVASKARVCEYRVIEEIFG